MARSANLPPTVMWGVGKSNRWSQLDLLLLRALQMYEDSLCSGCRQPLAHTMDVSNTLAFEVAEVSCGACQQLENKSKQEKEAKSGLKRYIRNLMSERFR